MQYCVAVAIEVVAFVHVLDHVCVHASNRDGAAGALHNTVFLFVWGGSWFPPTSVQHQSYLRIGAGARRLVSYVVDCVAVLARNLVGHSEVLDLCLSRRGLRRLCFFFLSGSTKPRGHKILASVECRDAVVTVHCIPGIRAIRLPGLQPRRASTMATAWN